MALLQVIIFIVAVLVAYLAGYAEAKMKYDNGIKRFLFKD